MSSGHKPLEEIVRELPPDSQAKVREFVDSLLEESNRRGNKKLRQNWAGALSDYGKQYTSVQLQKKALEWRGD
jgi:hypothetical protein